MNIRTRFAMLVLACVATQQASVVSAQTQTTPGPVFVSLNDGLDNLKASVNAPASPGGVAGAFYIIPETNPTTFAGFDPSATGVIANELPGLPAQGGQLGAIDLHFEYLSSMQIPNGVAVPVNFNIFGNGVDEPTTTLSDTLNVTFTGHTPGGGDNNNVSVDLHFRSDNDTIGVTALANGIPVNEPFGYQDLSLLVAAAGGPADFNVQYVSVVPEPSTAAMLGLGIASLSAWRSRKRIA